MSIKMKFMRFCKSRVALDFRTTSEAQMIADRLRRTTRYELLKHTNEKGASCYEC